ncbi:BRCA1-associated RING domain protein 1 [Chamberlinius hualienensis]
MFKNSLKAFDELESKLKCFVCSSVVVDALVKDCCDHFFCRNCLPKLSADSCNVCKLPYLSSETRSYDIINDCANACLKMKKNVMVDLLNCDNVVIPEPPSRVKEVRNPLKRPSLLQQSEKSKRTSTDLMNSSVLSAGKSDKGPSNKIDKRNGKGETPLHVASLKGKTADVERYLEMGADPNTKDNAGWTPLHEVCSKGYTVITQMLLKYGANVNAVSSTSTTPLHDAVINGKLDIVKLLLSYGADKYMQTAKGFTALDLADDNENKEIRAILLCKDKFPRPKVDTTELSLVSSKFVITSTGLNDCQRIQFQKLEKVLNAQLVDTFNDEVTHLVASDNGQRTCSRTLKYLNGVLKGIWVVSTDWVDECLIKQRFVKENSFEIKGTYQFPDCNGPKKGRENVLKKPGLFNGCRFYFYGKFVSPSPPKADLMRLVEAAEGVVLNEMPHKSSDLLNGSPFHMKRDSKLSGVTYFVIYCENVTNLRKLQDFNSKSVRALPQTWLLDCLTTFEIEDP